MVASNGTGITTSLASSTRVSRPNKPSPVAAASGSKWGAGAFVERVGFVERAGFLVVLCFRFEGIAAMYGGEMGRATVWFEREEVGGAGSA